MRIPFIGGTSNQRSVSVSSQRTVNMIPELDPTAKFQAALYQRPGLATWSIGASKEVRGSIVFGDNLYTVNGETVNKFGTDASVSTIGTIGTSTGPVSMSSNLSQICIVDGTNGYTSDGATVAVISDSDFPDTATRVDYLDGYGIFNDPANNGRFYISSLNDFTAIDGTDFATAQRDPDALVAHVVNNRELWLLGAVSTEVWYNSGAADFPFQPIDQAFSEWGCAATHSAAAGAGSVFWLGASNIGGNIVMMSQGLQGVRVSDHSLEDAIEGYATISDAIGWVMQERGHILYVLTFPTADATWVFDMNTGLWHEWKSFGVGRFRANTYSFFNGEHTMGDFENGNIFQFRPDASTDATAGGGNMERIRTDKFVSADDRERLFHRRFELEVEPGTGTATVDPQVVLQWSDDNGHTWSNEHWRGLGKLGEYNKRLVWRSLGRSRNRIYRVKVTDECNLKIIGGSLIVDRGTP